MLDFLLDKKRKSPVKFDVFAYHVAIDKNSADIVEDYLARKGIGFEVDRDALADVDLESASKDKCFLCSWNRRKAIFFAARRHECNKVAFGHNMDDVVQTYLMNIFFKASISTMCPKQKFFDGEVVVIRPLVYLREDELSRLSNEQGYPDIPACKWAKENKREQIKEVLSYLKKKNHGTDIVKNAFLSTMNIHYGYLPRKVN